MQIKHAARALTEYPQSDLAASETAPTALNPWSSRMKKLIPALCVTVFALAGTAAYAADVKPAAATAAASAASAAASAASATAKKPEKKKEKKGGC